MTPERRIKRFLVPLDHLAAYLRGVGVDRPLPADASVLFALWSPDHNAVMLTVHSLAYDPILPGSVIPFSANGPIPKDQP